MNDQALEYAREAEYLINKGNEQGLRDAWMVEVQAVGGP